MDVFYLDLKNLRIGIGLAEAKDCHQSEMLDRLHKKERAELTERNSKRQMEFLLSRYLVHSALANKYSSSNTDHQNAIYVSHDAHGAPYLALDHTTSGIALPDISLTHTRVNQDASSNTTVNEAVQAVCACALGFNKDLHTDNDAGSVSRLGIDLEAITPRSISRARALDAAMKSFDAKSMLAKGTSAQESAICAWTMTEAFAKASGIALMACLGNIEFVSKAPLSTLRFDESEQNKKLSASLILSCRLRYKQRESFHCESILLTLLPTGASAPIRAVLSVVY